MGKQTGFNRRNIQYHKRQKAKIFTKKANKPPLQLTTDKPIMKDKKRRREEKKLAIKLAKKEAKQAKKRQMAIEEDGYEDIEEEK